MSASRVRRAAVKAINYAKEQEFSDEDLFEDEEEEPVEKKRGRPKSAAKRKDVDVDDDDEMFSKSDKPVYTEKGYDPSLPPIRERFSFLPEFEEDGSPKIELIVGRRPVDEKEDAPEKDSEAGEGEEEEGEDEGAKSRRSKRGSKKGKDDDSPKTKINTAASPGGDGIVEYEYLVKYKGRSYLHLEWLTGADLESMNKSAKGLYRRYLKKLAIGGDDELESPDFDPSYVVPEKILDEADQEIPVELSDKELLKWEIEREKELEAEKDDEDENGETEEAQGKMTNQKDQSKSDEEEEVEEEIEWPDEVDFKTLSVDFLRKIAKKEGAFYPTVKGSDNPYSDGYITEPPKKPRASYLFFQCTMRPYYVMKNPNTPQAELMSILGETWRSMGEEEKASFQALANEEMKEYENQKVLLEKAQKPNGVWQPLRRCRMVLDRLAADSFAEIFLEPVDLEEFPDYEDIVDSMMDLGTVRQRLEEKRYQAPEQYARDMRRIWNNCKIYNQHGSAIWHVADYMSKQFERLYHAWVLEFRERYLRWADPRARPWEHSCRKHDGKCGTPDNKMVLCDHCDAMYGLQCLPTPLKKVPPKAWHCPDCKPKLKSTKGTRMLSATAEHAARKRTELGDIPKKKITRTMYLVKWSSLGYEFCTWETKDDIGSDKLISAFHKREKGFSDEADMPGEVIQEFVKEVTHVNVSNASGSGVVPELRAQLYAQSRVFQFLKFAVPIPENLGFDVGPSTTAIQHSMADGKHCREVVECVREMVFRVARRQRPRNLRSDTTLSPPMTGEYDAIIPITANGLMMNVGEIHGSVSFLGYRQYPDGSKGPAEISNMIRNIGDRIIAVDGVSTYRLSFQDVIGLLKESGKRKYAYMRFLESRYSACDSCLTSVGAKGRYAYGELQKKLITDRRRILIRRKLDALDDEQHVEESEDDASEKDNESDADSEAGSEGSFQPDSDDEELMGAFAGSDSPTMDKDPVALSNGPDVTKVSEGVDGSGAAVAPSEAKPESATTDADNEMMSTDKASSGYLCREETTRSLGLRLLDVDLGYSSDEAGDEDCAFFIDGVDDTFERANDIDPIVSKQKAAAKNKTLSQKLSLIPASKTEFSALGERGKLAVAAALSTDAPETGDFKTYPEVPMDAPGLVSPVRTSTKRSAVKIEQVNPSSDEVIHVWANVEAAAATLQLPLQALRQVLREEYDEDVGEEVGGFRWRYAMAGAKVTAGGTSATKGGGGKKAKEAWLEFRDKLYDPSEPHSYKNGNRLRDYQVDGVNWLASMWYKKQGCILADEMGLGKTVQIVCYVEHIFRVEKIQRPFLVVVPLSTVEHWRREFEGWTDMVCCIYHDRQRIWRDVLREYEWYFEDRPHTPEFLKFDVLVTTYDTLIGDFDIISQIPFRVAVVDEAHRLRNQKGKLLECMREISARGTIQYGYQSRVLMSGTPLQNDLTELWTLLNFIEPQRFSDIEQFQEKFGNMANRSQVESLQQMISPFMLRRVKEDVAKDIPAKEETVIDVELTSIQKQYYRAIFEHNHAFLNMGGSRQGAPKLMNIQMELRKVCNHPFLLDGVEHRETDRQFREFLDKGAFDGKTPELQQQMLNEHGYIMTSGKMVLLDKLLPKLRQEGHKILIFSQMVKMIDLISEYCDFRNFNYERLDGRVRGTERQKAIDRFETDKNSFLFLLSTRAGGVGINLTAADICIIFDSDWNPQARCHRIGQTKDVRIYRLVTSRSFEQEMFDRASKKLGLEQAVLGSFEKESEDDKPSQQEMEQLLKKGAYALLEDDNDAVTKEFCADDIESILAKRTRTRVVEGTKTASWLNKQGMVVSKSKFSSESGATLDLDDPLFWQKVMPDFVTPSLMLQKLRDLEDEVEGKTRGPGRGRWRKKDGDSEKVDDPQDQEGAAANGDSADDDAPTKDADGDDGQTDGVTEVADVPIENDDVMSEDDDDGEESEKKTKQLTRGQIRKINKFMSDLKSMMQSLVEEEDEEGLSSDERDACQKLLLTISVKEKVFNEEQRLMAKKFLKLFEGDRRRRCRTSDQQRFQPGPEDDVPSTPTVREELMIRGKKRKKRRKREMEEEEDDAPAKKRSKRQPDSGSGYLGEDGYLHHSDSEDDWSDVGNDLYLGSKDRISRKEAARRRQWAAGDDAATAAGRAWPVIPRPMVKKMLSAVLDKVIKYDEENGGVFSVPVPKDEFPEYYEEIKKPMDYGSMKAKLENGEYRSAQALQKDFILILQNCRKFNADSSDIVKEARRQHLLRPKFLKEAAADCNLFITEDGSVLEVFDERPGSGKKKSRSSKSDAGEEVRDAPAASAKSKGKKAGKKTKSNAEEQPDKGDNGSKKKKSKKKKSKLSTVEENDDEGEKKPRIRIKMKSDVAGDDENGLEEEPQKMKAKKGSKRRRDAEDHDGDEPDIESTPIPKKKRKQIESQDPKKDRANDVSDSAPPVDDDSGPASVFLDLDFWKSSRMSLDGTFKAARKNVMSQGAWELPVNVPDDSFAAIANDTLDKMNSLDKYSLFEKEVTEKEAPGYYDVVKYPMDFGKMREKVKDNEYGTGTEAAAAFFQDFKRVFDNCYLYNDEGDVTEEASRMLGLLPEAFVSSCIKEQKHP